MEALRLVETWPVPTVAAAVVDPAGDVHTVGPIAHRFRLASISKMFVGWCALIAAEEGIVDLDQPAGQPGCTLRHLLGHAGGYAFDGPDPIAAPGRRRIYSNTGIELAAEAVAVAAEMPFPAYLHDAILEPLALTSTTLRGSPAHGIFGTVADLVTFSRELAAPMLITHENAAEFASVQFPGLAGIVPGVGRYDDCVWGLGAEVRGHKQPHWTGRFNSPATYGHFGGAGTLMWVDPGAQITCIALTDRPFDEWSDVALTAWPQLSDAVLVEAAG